MPNKQTRKSSALNALIKRAGPLVTFTAGVDGITDLRELDEQDPPPLYAPGTPALDLFHRCLLPAIRAFDACTNLVRLPTVRLFGRPLIRPPIGLRMC